MACATFPHPFRLPAPRLAVRHAVFGIGRGAGRWDVALSGLCLRCQPRCARGCASGRPGLRVGDVPAPFLCSRTPACRVTRRVWDREGCGKVGCDPIGVVPAMSAARRARGARRGGPGCGWVAFRTCSVFAHPDLPCDTPCLGSEGVREGGMWPFRACACDVSRAAREGARQVGPGCRVGGFSHLFCAPAPRLAVRHAVFGIRRGAGRVGCGPIGLCLRCQPRGARGCASGRPGLRVRDVPAPFLCSRTLTCRVTRRDWERKGCGKGR